MTSPARRPVHPARLFLLMAGVTLLVAGLAVLYLPANPIATWHAFRATPWLDGLCRWDAGWFRRIAKDGYGFDAGGQSPVAFYPLYPLLIRALFQLVPNYYVAGIAIAMSAGFGSVLLFHRWVSARLEAPPARTSLLVLLLFPFSLYLFGALYSDALFLFCTLAAFTVLEMNHPWAAGLLGAAATATRPVGLAVVIGLALRAAERRGVFGEATRRGWHPEKLRVCDAGVLLSLAGMGLYWRFLWVSFGDPFAWVHAASAPGWYVEMGPATWFKAVFVRDLLAWRWDVSNIVRTVHAILCVAALATIPAVWRRFGIGYAAYTLVVLGIPAVSSPDFFGMGRYMLAAFPCFAIAGVFLHERPRLQWTALAASVAGQIAITALYAAWYPAS